MTPFSSPHRLIAKQDVAMRLFREIVLDTVGWRRWFVLVSAEVSVEGSIDVVSDRDNALRFANDIGFVKVRIT